MSTCLLTILAVLHLLTNRVATNADPVNPEKAFDAWRLLSNDPRSFHIDAQPAEHESHLTSLVSSREPTPNFWTDPWLAALAMSLDYEIVTFDRGFKSFRGPRLRLLEITAR